MGFSGTIGVVGSDDFKLDLTRFKEALRQRWPYFNIQEYGDSSIDFGTMDKNKSTSFHGSANTQGIAWNGSLAACAEFCLWFRRYIPPQYQLLASDDNVRNMIAVSYSTTEEEFVDGLLIKEFEFEITLPANTRDTCLTLAERFKQDWPESIEELSPDPYGFGHWYLLLQQDFIEYDKGRLGFADTDLQSAAQMAVWWRNVLPLDQNLILRGKYYLEPVIQVEMELTSTTTEAELLDFLTRSFVKE